MVDFYKILKHLLARLYAIVKPKVRKTYSSEMPLLAIYRHGREWRNLIRSFKRLRLIPTGWNVLINAVVNGVRCWIVVGGCTCSRSP